MSSGSVEKGARQVGEGWSSVAGCPLPNVRTQVSLPRLVLIAQVCV